MKTILIFVAEGFEEIELITPLDIWRRAGYRVLLAGINENKIVKGQQGLRISVDIFLNEVNIDEIDLIFIPGGEGHKLIKESEKCMSIIDLCVIKEKFIAAICAGPLVVVEYLINKKATCYPAFERQIENWEDKDVVIDNIFITSQGAGTSFELAFAVVNILSSADKVGQLKKIITYRY